jgi:hypothetical protein
VTQDRFRIALGAFLLLAPISSAAPSPAKPVRKFVQEPICISHSLTVAIIMGRSIMPCRDLPSLNTVEF